MAEQVLNDVAREMLDIGKADSLQAIDEALRPTAQQVRDAAQELINYASSLQAMYGLTVADQLATLNTSSEAAVLNFSKKYIKEKAEYQQLMIHVFNFQNLANEFLGQKIVMTFVAISPSSGKVTLYNMDNSIEDLTLDKAAQSRGGYITGRISSLSKIKNASKDIVNTEYNESDKNRLDQTFQEVWQRYRISKNKLKLGGAAYIIWYLGTWDGVWISGAGPLGEAYVAFFVNNYLFSNKIEPNVRDFMLNSQYGSIKADNASGFLKGDIVKGAAQFGVKIKGAQPMSYMDVIKYAQELLKASDVETYLKELQIKLESEGEQNMVKPLANFAQESYEVLLKDMQSRLDKIGSDFSGNGVLIAKF